MNVIDDVDNSVSWEKSKEVMNIAKYNINECREVFSVNKTRANKLHLISKGKGVLLDEKAKSK